MNSFNLGQFEEILEKVKVDEKDWERFNDEFSPETQLVLSMPKRREEEIMERMFLTYYVKQYLEQQRRIKTVIELLESVSLKEYPVAAMVGEQIEKLLREVEFEEEEDANFEH